MPSDQLNLLWSFQAEDLQQLLDSLAQTGSIDFSKQDSSTVEIYDCFDQSIRKAGLCLSRQKGRFQLGKPRHLHTSQFSSKANGKTTSVFWQDFENPEFKSELKKLLKLRAASCIATLKSERQHFALRNSDRKIVARLKVETLSASESEQQLCLLSLTPLLGYEEETQVLSSFLDSASELERDVPNILEWALAASGNLAPPPSPQQAIQLTPEQSVQSAVNDIASFLIKTARRSQAGIIADIDTEFLHDYRVSIRKLRSVLSLIKGAYSKEDTKHLKTEFGDLARTTNRLRDLDVYLLEEESIQSLLPEYLVSGLERMFSDFRSERVKELQTIRRHFRSKKQKERFDRLSTWFEKGPQEQGTRSQQPIGKVAAKEIRRHYSHVSKFGAAINSSTPDEEVHELRIECKKLRYLLELFSSLYPENEIKAIIKQLKGLQTTLGNFNDYCVQQQFLAHYLETAPKLSRSTSAALGGLIAHLNQKQHESHSRVSNRFIQFNDPKMSQRFHRLFETKGKAES